MNQRRISDNPPRECLKDWRGFFNEQILKRAAQFLTMHQYEDFACTEREAHAIIGQGASMGRALIRNAPASCSDDWDPKSFACSCLADRRRYAETGERVTLCVHEAALLMLWERKRGPWRFSETSEESLIRQRREEQAEQLRKERIRRKRQYMQESTIRVDVGPFFPRREADAAPVYFQVRRAMEGRNASLYALNRAKALLREGSIAMSAPEITYTPVGQQALSVSGHVSDALESQSVSVTLSASELLSHACDCRRFSMDDSLCEHELALLARVGEYVERENPGDATDSNAERFFQEMDAAQASAEASETGTPDAQKSPVLTLLPRIVLEEWREEAILSFKIGLNGRFIILKNLRELSEAAEQERKLTFSKTVRVDFSTMTFTPDSAPWLDFIRRRIHAADLLKAQIPSYAYWNEPAETRTLARESLQGVALDRFYDAADGSACELVDRNRKHTGTIRVGHADLKIRLVSRRIADANGGFLGIEVAGSLPMTLQGDSSLYLLDESSLSKLDPEETRALQPFLSVAETHSGQIRFLVGKNRLAEFYYRIAPRLLESPYVEFVDNCAKEAETVLPPEPSFLFRIDLEDDCFLEEFVSYGDADPCRLPRRAAGTGIYADSAQEARVEKVIRRYFPRFDPETSTYRGDDSEENLYRVLTEGVPELSRYGEVQGSNTFQNCVIRSVPQIHVGVSVESGLLDISILSKDISTQELLDVLESYRRKKTFHRLKNGDFVTLSADDQLASLDALTHDLNLSAEEVIQGHIELPLFRALYLDTMLDKHHELAANRDRTYRGLIRGFRTIRDADYEVPAAQADILRPYQVYGYKWLRTLAAAGFGGILADEMGLGKTLQAITFLQALKEAGEAEPALIVCPASLVYNWQEEFHHFAPTLSVLPVAGNAAARKSALQGASAVDAYITSYDLLRQDIAIYAQLGFSVMILDEAQYIKNQKAGMTKAVKIVRARTRLALTGTPIENRLAELWSIFDFLMPGFLYDYPTFLRRFETPITKNHEPEPAERLKQVTAPFILRRLKSDVLKDLPPKLEEIRYTRFEDEQRKLYDGQVVRMKRMLAGSGQSGEDRIRIFAELMRIRQICCDPSLIFEDYHGGSAKRAACLELVQSAMGGGHKMLIFSQFASMLALLEEDLHKAKIPCYKIVGATPKEERLRLVRAFNEDETPVFLISLKAGGTGLNLTGADVVIHYDPWWNLAAQNQATDRAHRIGQKNQVTVYRMIVKGSIEEKILSMQEAKKDLADAILSGERESLFTLSNEELMDLLN